MHGVWNVVVLWEESELCQPVHSAPVTGDMLLVLATVLCCEDEGALRETRHWAACPSFMHAACWRHVIINS
jgi:hypothetical protein